MARIMIVDDSILMRRNLKMMLTEAGYEVVAEASNGMEAYKEYVKHEPDLVTMDITMPVMSGIEALKKILATYPNAKIIMISAQEQKSMVFEAIQSGAKHYILKPITIEKMLATISDVLEGPRTHDKAGPGADKPVHGEEEVASFSIENKNGIFVIKIGASIDADSLQSVKTAIQGILFVKPLKVVFQFGHIDAIADDHLEQIIGFVGQLQGAEGIVRFVCRDQAVISQLKSKDAAMFAKIYTDMQQIIL